MRFEPLSVLFAAIASTVLTAAALARIVRHYISIPEESR